MRVLSTLLTISLLALPLQTKENAPPKEQTPLGKAYQKRQELFSKWSAARGKLMRNPQLVSLRKDWNEAQATLNKKVASVTGKERQAEKAAREALSKAIDNKISTNKDISGLRKKQALLAKKRRDLNFQIATVELQLYHNDSPLQQTLDSDASLQAMQRKAYSTQGKERAVARNKYYQARRSKLKTLKGAQALFAKVDQLKGQIKATEKESYQTWTEINKITRSIRGGKQDDAQLKVLRDKLTTAAKARRAASFQPSTKKERDALYQASRAYGKKLGELTKADKALQLLQKQIDAVNAEIRQLTPKKPKPKPKTKPTTKAKP